MIKLVAQGDEYVLSVPGGATVSLSGDDVLRLVQSAQALRNLVLAKQKPENEKGFVATPVVKVSLNTDLHGIDLVLGMICKNGTHTRFLLPLGVAEPLSQCLSERVSRMKRTKAAIRTQ